MTRESHGSAEENLSKSSSSKTGPLPRACAFAPATVSNVACGFDVLGFAIDGPGDRVIAEVERQPGRIAEVEIAEITGDGGVLPLAADRNTAGIAVAALLRDRHIRAKVVLRIHKEMPLASGLGSSAASAVAGVWAAAAALGLEASDEELVGWALEAETEISGGVHPDNVVPCALGGWQLIRSAEPLDTVALPVPEELWCVVLQPEMEIETRGARQLLGTTLELQVAVEQWGNLGSLVAALHRGDLELLGRSLVDVVAEPKRAALVPGFADIKQAALDAGALGSSLSGSGPSIFALGSDRSRAEAAGDAMVTAAARHGLAATFVSSRVGAAGARLLPPPWQGPSDVVPMVQRA